VIPRAGTCDVIRNPVLAQMQTTCAGLGGESREAHDQAIARARRDLGPEQADTLWVRVEAMSYDETVEYVRSHLDRAIAST